MFPIATGVTRAFLLIALALGYIVCSLANKEEKALRKAGYVIGISIIVLSSLLILGNLFLEATTCASRLEWIRPQQRMMRERAPKEIPKSLLQPQLPQK